MKILITGANGQLGSELVRQGGAHELIATDCHVLDITDAQAVMRSIEGNRPDVVINAAAYTAVDRAESDEEAAYRVNRDGPANLATVSGRVGIPLVHVSTDYVYDGSKQAAFTEDDPVAPLGVYGASKLAGEQAVLADNLEHLILRTSWVFSSHGNNFVKTMLRLGAEREELGVVADQTGCPTAAAELARGIYAALDAGMSGRWGIYHFCQPEATTWYDFATAIFSEARAQGRALKLEQVRAITTADYPTPARRPANSEMACDKFQRAFGYTIRPWRESLHDVIEELNDG